MYAKIFTQKRGICLESRTLKGYTCTGNYFELWGLKRKTDWTIIVAVG